MESIYESLIQFMWPEICIALSAIVILLSSLFIKKRSVLTAISAVGIIGSAVLDFVCLQQYSDTGITYASYMLSADTATFYFRLLFAGIALFVVLGSYDYAKNFEKFHAEYLVLIHLALLGMTLLVSSFNIISLFVSLELMALSFYGLTALMKDQRSSEAALKYILLGGINSAVLLFGLVLLYGFTGETTFNSIGYVLATGGSSEAGLIFALVLIVAGFSFKIAGVPFHMWAPDVYEGSPTSVTLYLSTASKLAGMGILFRLMYSVFAYAPSISGKLTLALAVISVLSMFIGNLGAIAQSSVKKMLAFSGIAQSGYMLLGIIAILLTEGSGAYSIFTALFIFALAFALAEIAAFSGVFTFSDAIKSDNIEDYRGVAKRSPFIAVIITIGLLSLMGLPVTGGFIGKFGVFSVVGNIPLIIIGVVNSVISAVYYLKFIRVMWTGTPSEESKVDCSIVPYIIMTCAATLVIAIGIFGFKFI